MTYPEFINCDVGTKSLSIPNGPKEQRVQKAQKAHRAQKEQRHQIKHKQQGAPQGQALIEMMLVIGVIGLLAVLISWIGVLGSVSNQVAHSARSAVFDCDMQPGYCVTTSHVQQLNLRTRLFSSDRREVLSQDQPSFRNYQSLHKAGTIFEKHEDVRLLIDLPKVDGADKNLLAKLSDTFRSLSMKSGPAIFGLPTPDQLTRSTVRASLWGGKVQKSSALHLPEIQFQSRIALISDSWSAMDAQHFYRRVQEGEDPSQFADAAVSYFYAPAKDLLMPALDLVGLESNTKSFRDRFHRIDHSIAFPNTQTRIR
jgi:hypothetical protein